MNKLNITELIKENIMKELNDDERYFDAYKKGMNFTFKTSLPKGHYRSFYNKTTYIKLNKFVVGQIDSNRSYRIVLNVKKNEKYTDDNENCEWTKIFLKRKFESMDDSKKFLNDNIEKIMKEFILFGYIHAKE